MVAYVCKLVHHPMSVSSLRSLKRTKCAAALATPTTRNARTTLMHWHNPFGGNVGTHLQHNTTKRGSPCAAASTVGVAGVSEEPSEKSEQDPTSLSHLLALARDSNCRVSLGDEAVKTCTSDAVWGGIGVTIAFLLLGLIDMHLSPSGLPFMIGSYGTISVLLFGAPNAPVLHKWNVVAGHMLAAVIAILWFQVQLPVWILRAAAMGTMVFFMLLTGSVHPPGGALIMTFMDSAKMQSLQWWFVLYPGLLGLLVIFPIAALTSYMKANFKFNIRSP